MYLQPSRKIYSRDIYLYRKIFSYHWCSDLVFRWCQKMGNSFNSCWFPQKSASLASQGTKRKAQEVRPVLTVGPHNSCKEQVGKWQQSRSREVYSDGVHLPPCSCKSCFSNCDFLGANYPLSLSCVNCTRAKHSHFDGSYMFLPFGKLCNGKSPSQKDAMFHENCYPLVI